MFNLKKKDFLATPNSTNIKSFEINNIVSITLEICSKSGLTGHNIALMYLYLSLRILNQQHFCI